MQKARRGNVTSVDEPNAFRIARSPPSFDASNSNHRDGQYIFASDFSQTPQAVFSRSAPDFSHPYQYLVEPASWLAAPDLSSPAFSAHDFLQHVLSQKFDKASRPTHIPVLENSFDADAALAALDTVESALRKKRDIARKEEELSRDELRKALHMSAKKREQLVRTADTISANSAFGDVGRQAAEALSSDVAALKTDAENLSTLQDTRDLLSLLTMEDCELDAVRVSKLLAKARHHLDDGSLAALLSPDDMAIAREEMDRCENELAYSVHSWMRSAVDSGHIHIVRECAQAAEELNASESFIDSYISHVLAFDHSHQAQGAKHNLSGKPPDLLEKFRSSCWETADAVGEIIPTIRESFAEPSQALVSVVRILSERKVIATAESTMQKSMTCILEDRQASLELNQRSISHAPLVALRTSSLERGKLPSTSDVEKNWTGEADDVSTRRRAFLKFCASVFKDMARLRSDLLTQCGSPGAKSIEKEFSKGSDPYLEFANRWLPEYLKSERKWIDEQFGTAFFDITRIEAHAPRLAPREGSDADVYHRYRAFYGHISSRYQEMTRIAIGSTYEALCRVGTVLNSITVYKSIPQTKQTRATNNSPEQNGDLRTGDTWADGTVLNDNLRSKRTSFPVSSHQGERPGHDEETYEAHSPQTTSELKRFPRTVLDGLVMRYLANSETLLQAATHLLPVSEDTAKMQELWVSGASPLTAYMQAIEVLSRSNEMLDEFLLTLALTDQISELSESVVAMGDDSIICVTQEAREALHRDLTSGLSDLGSEAQAGVRAAVASVRARLSAMLSAPSVRSSYSAESSNKERNDEHWRGDDKSATVGLDLEPSSAFMSASTFVEQQLQSVLSNVHGGNREFVISELAMITRDTVLECWSSCDGPLPFSGALQLVADGRTMTRVFQSHRDAFNIVACLPGIGQLFLESAGGLWKCVESKSLASVEARTLVQLLQKREDRYAGQVVKVCQSLGASLQDLEERHYGDDIYLKQ